jgi:hypothetical protein
VGSLRLWLLAELVRILFLGFAGFLRSTFRFDPGADLRFRERFCAQHTL